MVRREPARDLARAGLIFLGLATLLLVRSRELFVRAIVEEGDSASNSILVERATHFTQLVGNYSRMGFHHPGPAFLYLQALGQWLCYDVLRVVPAQWNGQTVAILLLNASVLAITITIVCRGLPRAAWSVSVVTAVVLVFAGSHPGLITANWPPFTYFAPYLLLLTAATSVAAGTSKDLWALALALGLLIHGHAEFLGLATLIAAVAVVTVLRRERGHVRAFLAERRRHLVAAGAVLAVFAAPIVIDLVVSWPGEFGKYLAYRGSGSLHAPWSAVAYLARIWSDGQYSVVLLVLTAVCLTAAYRWRSTDPFLRHGLRLAAVAAGSCLLYAIAGVDSLNETYIGLFTNAIPLFLLLICVVAMLRRPMPARRQVPVALGTGLVAAALVAAVSAPALANTRLEMPDAPAAVAALVARTTPGQPIVLSLAPLEAWAEALPLALTGHRHGVRICFADPSLGLVATPAYVCTPDEKAHGLPVTITRLTVDPPAGLTTVAPLGRSQVWVATDAQ